MDLALVPSLAADTQQLVPVPATVVLGIAANLTCDGCTLHLVVDTGTGGWVQSNAVNHTVGIWGKHTFARTLAGEQAGSGVVRFGVVLQLGSNGGPMRIAHLNAHCFLDSSIENAEIMDNCP